MIYLTPGSDGEPGLIDSCYIEPWDAGFYYTWNSTTDYTCVNVTPYVAGFSQAVVPLQLAQIPYANGCQWTADFDGVELMMFDQGW